MLAGSSALADSDVTWPLKGKLKGQGEKVAHDLSGIACDRAEFPRLCLVIDDESQNAQVVILRDGELTAGDVIPLLRGSLDGKPLELDGEGVAFADGAFYVIGSHGQPRHLKDKQDDAKIAARIRATSQVYRVKIDPQAVNNKGDLTAPPEVKSSSRLRPLLVADQILKTYLDKPVKENGVSIEGVAIRDGRLYAGLRTPSLQKGAPVLSVSLGAVFADGRPDPQLHMLQLGAGRGIRDLATHKNGILVLAGPAHGKGGHFALYEWKGGASVSLLKELPEFHDKDGSLIWPEALLPLDSSAAGSRLLLLFDGPKGGAPHLIQLGR